MWRVWVWAGVGVGWVGKEVKALQGVEAIFSNRSVFEGRGWNGVCFGWAVHKGCVVFT